MDIKKIFEEFKVDASAERYGNGHINDTFLCKCKPYTIVQRINTQVFERPDKLMENITAVTEHLKRKISLAGGDESRETLNVIPTKSGKSYLDLGKDGCYRMYKYIENTVSIDVTENYDILESAGEAFGGFQQMLSDFNADSLYETIKRFHDTPYRVEQLETAIKNAKTDRKEKAKKEIQQALNYKKYAETLWTPLCRGEIPLRVTHNDTKLNNVLFDKDTLKALCVIDLDTVMPGSLLFDFGDALRYCASTAAEDETNLDNVRFDLKKFESFTKGFLKKTADCLSKTEKRLLPVSALVLTYECGIRFLTDYLNGDIYFKIHRENHNLDRAGNQLKLVCDIEKKLPQMEAIVNEVLS